MFSIIAPIETGYTQFLLSINQIKKLIPSVGVNLK